MSEKRMVYAEDVIQRICSMAPEILGGEYNPDIEDEVEQLVCVVESTPTVAPGKTLPQLLEQLDAGECKGIKSATAYKIAEFAREQGYLE